MSTMLDSFNSGVSKNPHRVSIKHLASEYGYDDTDEFLINECQDSVVPACCANGCSVEPDGTCHHGCPSPLIVLGII